VDESNRLQLNPVKTEFFWYASALHHQQIPTNQRFINALVLPAVDVLSRPWPRLHDSAVTAAVNHALQRSAGSVRCSQSREALLT